MSTPTCEDYFNNTSPPVAFQEIKRNLRHFCDKYKETQEKIVLVTSGGTTVPLEHNTVRFVDNFSAGTRGSASAEYFIEQGYGVIFLHREKSLEPFVRHFMGQTFLDKLTVVKNDVLGSSSVIVKPGYQDQMVPILSKYLAAKENKQLLFISFTTLSDYLWLLRASCSYLAVIGRRAMLYLAAAVSDFYIPSDNMPEHKIQSAAGAPRIELQLVPKMLEPLVNLWVPNAFVISFKLETDETKLMAGAQAALKKYNHHFVIGNLLQNRKSQVSVVWPDGSIGIVINKAEQKAGLEIETKIISFLTEKHDVFIAQSTEAEWSKLVLPLKIDAGDVSVSSSSPPSSPPGAMSDEYDANSTVAMNISSTSSSSQNHDTIRRSNVPTGMSDDSD